MQISRICRDGHCLLPRFIASKFRSLGRYLPATIGDIGPRARALWIRSARKILLEGDGTASGPTSGINARGILLDGGEAAEEYLGVDVSEQPAAGSMGWREGVARVGDTLALPHLHITPSQ